MPILATIPNALAAFVTGSYTVTRPGTAVLVKGVMTSQPSTSFSVDGSLQPLSDEELQRFPEGARTSGLRKLFTTTKLINGDIVAADGFTWEVSGEKDYNIAGGFYVLTITKRED